MLLPEIAKLATLHFALPATNTTFCLTCNQRYFLFYLQASLQVNATNTTSELSFSTMGRIKTYLRNT